MASLTRTIRRHIKWTKPKSRSDTADDDIYKKQKMDRKDIVKGESTNA